MSNSAVRATRPPAAIRSRTPRLPRATSSSLTPSGRSTSRVRGCTARARDSCTRSEAASTSTGGTPNAASWAASVRPVGPAPTTSTSHRSFSGSAMYHCRAATAAPPGPRPDLPAAQQDRDGDLLHEGGAGEGLEDTPDALLELVSPTRRDVFLGHRGVEVAEDVIGVDGGVAVLFD